MSRIQERLDQFVSRIKSAAGPNLVSVIVYGSAATGDVPDKYSDINLLCVLRSASTDQLRKVSPVLSWWTTTFRDKPPLFVTLDELRNSADVFAIEMLDVKANHRVLCGENPLASIDVPMNLHRVQVEHELRTMILRLRQQFLITPEDEEMMEQVLAKSLSGLVTLLRHAIIAVGGTAPASREDTITVASKTFQIDSSPLMAVLDLRNGRRPQSGLQQIYRDYMACLTAVIMQIDKFMPLSQWRRVQ